VEAENPGCDRLLTWANLVLSECGTSVVKQRQTILGSYDEL
jgi:hypothetical protein